MKGQSHRSSGGIFTVGSAQKNFTVQVRYAFVYGFTVLPGLVYLAERVRDLRATQYFSERGRHLVHVEIFTIDLSEVKKIIAELQRAM